MTLAFGFKAACWVIIFLIGGGFIRYDKYSMDRKITIGIPKYERGGFLNIGPNFSTTGWIFFRLFLTLLVIGVLRILLFILSQVFGFLLF